MLTEILPCPFCGGKATFTEHNEPHGKIYLDIGCFNTECLIDDLYVGVLLTYQTPEEHRKTQNVLIEKWNKRV